MRSHPASRSRYFQGAPRRVPGDDHAIPDEPPRSVRDRRRDARIGCRMDRTRKAQARAPSVSKPDERITAYIDPTIREDRCFVGEPDRTGSWRLCHPIIAADETNADLPANQESRSSSVAFGPHQAAQHRTLPWNRGGLNRPIPAIGARGSNALRADVPATPAMAVRLFTVDAATFSAAEQEGSTQNLMIYRSVFPGGLNEQGLRARVRSKRGLAAAGSGNHLS